jgi:F-type H+-transporting ATPase subunit gamma
MATERELNKRIRSVKNISQVTSALAAVSAAKVRRAQNQVMATRAYAGKAYEILHNLASQPGVGESGHPLLTVREQIRRTAVILITGDRGLAGAYNSNIVRRTELFIRALGKDHPADIIAVGRKGRDLMIRRGYNVIASFTGLSDAPTFLQVAPIAQVAIDDYLEGKVDQVFIAYTDFINMGTQRPSVKQLLPLRPLDLKGMAVGEYVKHVDLAGVAERVYSYEPEPAALLNTIVPRFTQLQVFQSVLEALASEHSARMLAMNNATDNAGGIVEELVVQRNKARQTTITSQIMDIVGGAEALVK